MDMDLPLCEEKLFEFAENFHDVFSIFSEDFSKILYINSSVEFVWGINRQYALENPLAMLQMIHPEDRTYVLQIPKNNPKTWYTEFRVMHPNGDIRWMRSHGQLVEKQTEPTKYVILVSSDITQHKRTSQLSTVGQLSEGIAHQVNNPLTTILVQSERILRRITADNELYQSVADIKEAATVAATSINRLLNMYSDEPGHCLPMDINQSLRNAIEYLRSTFESATFKLTVDLDKSIPIVRGYTELFQDAWINILLNAHEAIHGLSNGEITIRSAFMKKDKTIEVTIEDNGVGIPPEIIDNIFEPFYTTKAGGFGLGLAIAQVAIVRHDGTLSVITSKNHGTIFKVILPTHINN